MGRVRVGYGAGFLWFSRRPDSQLVAVAETGEAGYRGDGRPRGKGGLAWALH
jgi:hypothetical protein